LIVEDDSIKEKDLTSAMFEQGRAKELNEAEGQTPPQPRLPSSMGALQAAPQY
jgi:hypothetical protein